MVTEKLIIFTVIKTITYKIQEHSCLFQRLQIIIL